MKPIREIVRRVYAAMNVGDLSGVIEFAAPDIERVPDRRVGGLIDAGQEASSYYPPHGIWAR